VVKGFILLSDVYRDEKDYFQARATLLSIIDNTEIDDLLATAKRKLEELNALEKVSGEGVKEDDE
jgi:DNA-binding transcriptional regulator GbsR (MarR family)